MFPPAQTRAPPPRESPSHGTGGPERADENQGAFDPTTQRKNRPQEKTYRIGHKKRREVGMAAPKRTGGNCRAKHPSTEKKSRNPKRRPQSLRVRREGADTIKAGGKGGGGFPPSREKEGPHKRREARGGAGGSKVGIRVGTDEKRREEHSAGFRGNRPHPPFRSTAPKARGKEEKRRGKPVPTGGAADGGKPRAGRGSRPNEGSESCYPGAQTNGGHAHEPRQQRRLAQGTIRTARRRIRQGPGALPRAERVPHVCAPRALRFQGCREPTTPAYERSIVWGACPPIKRVLKAGGSARRNSDRAPGELVKSFGQASESLRLYFTNHKEPVPDCWWRGRGPFYGG